MCLVGDRRSASRLALRSLAVLVASLVAGVGSSNPVPQQGAARVDDVGVVLVILDAAGAPYLGAYGNHLPTSPNIDKLARTAGAPSLSGPMPSQHGRCPRWRRCSPAATHPAEHKRGPSSQETLWPRSCTKSDCRPPHSRRARTSPRSGGSPADLTCSTSTFPSGCLIEVRSIGV